MKKRLIAVIVAIALVLVSLGVFLIVRHVRNNRPPELAAIRERAITLINASHEINEIFWGEGLVTYPRVYHEYYERVPFYLTKTENAYVYAPEKTDETKTLYYYTFTDAAVGEIIAYQYCLSPESGVYVDVEKGDALTIADKIKYRYAKKTIEKTEEAIFSLGEYYYVALPEYQETSAEFYYTTSDEEYYDYVRLDNEYLSTAEIKEKAETVYAEDFLSSVYESIFTGITVSDHDSGTLYARYIDYTDTEGNTYLMKSNTWKAASVARVYLYDTIRMSEERRSNAKDVYLDVDTYVPGNENEIETITVSLTLQNGNWFLNSATY